VGANIEANHRTTWSAV